MKKVVAILLVTLLAITMVTGCGQTADKANDAATNQSSNSSSSDTQASVSTAASETITANLMVLHYMGEQTKRNGLKAWTDSITAKNPGITFDVQAVGSYTDYVTQLKTKIAAGDAPDIMFGKPKMLIELVKAGQIMELTDQPFVKNVDESILKSATIDQKIYSIPVSRQVMGVMYNKDMFKTYNLEAPKTYNEFLTIMDTFDKNGVKPFVRPYKNGNNPRMDFESGFRPVLSTISTFYADLMAGKTEMLDNPAFVESFTNYAKRLAYTLGDDLGTDDAKALQLFASGKAPMMITGNYSVGDIRKNNPTGNFGFFPVPTGADTDAKIMAVGSDDNFMLSAQTKNKEAAFKFFEYITSPEGANQYVAAAKAISTIKGADVAKDEPILADIASYISQYTTTNHEEFTALTGQYLTVWGQNIQWFASDPKVGLEGFVKKVKSDFAAIK